VHEHDVARFDRGGVAAVVRLAEISDAAAPVTRAAENVRLFIIMIILFRRRVPLTEC